MNDATELQQAQARLNEVQALYREWLALAPRLEAAQAEWRQAAAVMAQLNTFYDREYLPLRDAVEASLPLDERTPGEYRVLSEDALPSARRISSPGAGCDWRWHRLIRRGMATMPDNRRHRMHTQKARIAGFLP